MVPTLVPKWHRNGTKIDTKIYLTGAEPPPPDPPPVSGRTTLANVQRVEALSVI